MKEEGGVPIANRAAKSDAARPMVYACTAQGERWPVIDITDPRFALPADLRLEQACDCLARLVEDATKSHEIVAASSEGGLFEYGTDEAILANLRALCPDGRRQRIVVAGSVTCDDKTRRRAVAAPGFALVPRGLAAFAALASRAGFALERAGRTPLGDQILLLPVGAD